MNEIEQVYIKDFTVEKIFFHRYNQHSGKAHCGLPVSWRNGSALLPQYHAMKIGHPCDDCFPVQE